MTPASSWRDDVAAALPQWLQRQRWFIGKGHQPRLRPVGSVRLSAPQDEVGIGLWLLCDEADPLGTVYQVPLTFRSRPMDAPSLAQVAVLTRDQQRVWIYDGCHDGAFADLLIGLIVGTTAPPTGDPGSITLRGQRHPAGWQPIITGRRVLTGEQSNTSIIFTATDSAGAVAPIICKVFRVLHDGHNPDVELQSALADAGSRLVPRPLGSLAGTWRAAERRDGLTTGDLAFAQEFMPGTQDAWRVALRAVGDGIDFTDRARSLGVATAQVHTDLARVLPMRPATPADHDGALADWRQRLAEAQGEVAELVGLNEAAESVFARAAQASWPPLQRIHGDYHLGQVLDVPGRGWVLLDFEGEPLRPLADRRQVDLPLRDVAGMLRSFDYAAGSVAREQPARAAACAAWAASCRQAFLDGYAQVAPDPRLDPDRQALLAALELDKAHYEVGYEARNRPTWLGIPTDAIHRLCRLDGTPTDQASSRTPSPSDNSLNSTNSLNSHNSLMSQSTTAPSAARNEAHMSKPTTPTGSSASSADSAPTVAQPTPAIRPASWDELGLLVHGGHGNPHGVLGAHPWNGGVTIRALRPMAASVTVELPDGSMHPMDHDFEGVWQVQINQPEVTDYRVHVDYGDGYVHRQDDPYRFLPTLGEVDLHLIGEGRHEELWKVLGAHIRQYDGPMGQVTGTSFAVWAPNARAIRLTGDFNRWDGTAYPMRALGSTGVWEIFVPGVGENSTYKFEILGADGYRRSKADPLARATECPPATASVVTQSGYQWSDAEWMEKRTANLEPHNSAMSIYECHLGSWRLGSSYVDLAEHLVNYVKDMGFTHVEFLPVMEHPYGPSWGYQVTGYFAPTSRFGSPDDFRYLVDRLHQAGIGVILDWVPAHFPKDSFALGRFDGEPLYEHPDPRRGEHTEWGTYIFDYGRPQVRNFLVANACYWIEEFHIDGLRVDAVASMLYLDYSREDGQWYPNEYGGRENIQAMQVLQETNATVYRRYPGAITIAEESTSWGGVTKPTYMGGLGFGLKWNMGWMHDSLGYASLQPIYRQYHHNEMTFAMMYQYSENFCLPISHDEVVYGKQSMLMKMPGDRWEQLANLRVYFAHMWSHPGKQLIFMGSEFAQYAEWSDGSSLDWWLLDHEPHWRMHALVKDLNWLYRSHPALWELDNSWEGFSWIDANDALGNCYSFLRYGLPDAEGNRPVIACISNFAGMEHHQYRVGLPHQGPWREILNTDSQLYGGGGVGNLGQIFAEEVPWHGQPYSALVTIPKLGAVWFEPVHGAVAGGGGEEPMQVKAPRKSRGSARPELSNAPVVDEPAVKSELGELPPVTGS